MNEARCAGVQVEGWTTSGFVGEVARLRVLVNTVLSVDRCP